MLFLWVMLWKCTSPFLPFCPFVSDDWSCWSSGVALGSSWLLFPASAAEEGGDAGGCCRLPSLPPHFFKSIMMSSPAVADTPSSSSSCSWLRRCSCIWYLLTRFELMGLIGIKSWGRFPEKKIFSAKHSFFHFHFLWVISNLHGFAIYTLYKHDWTRVPFSLDIIVRG